MSRALFVQLPGMVTKKIIVEGKVQGVNFRNYAKSLADELLIKGQIRNTPDGKVEITATAEDGIVQQFIDWCYEGSPGSKVEHVTVEDLALKWFDDFTIVRNTN
jgi:acylphosphatase